VLLEFGGRARSFNRYVGEEVTRAATKFWDELAVKTRIAIGNTVTKSKSWGDSRKRIESLFVILLGLERRNVETNLRRNVFVPKDADSDGRKKSS